MIGSGFWRGAVDGWNADGGSKGDDEFRSRVPRMGVLISSGCRGVPVAKAYALGLGGEGDVIRLLFPFALECGMRGTLCTPVVLDGESMMEDSSSLS